MFAIKIKPGSEEFFKPIIESAHVEIKEGVTYYVIVDPDDAVKIVSEEELTKMAAEEDETYIRFE